MIWPTFVVACFKISAGGHGVMSSFFLIVAFVVLCIVHEYRRFSCVPREATRQRSLLGADECARSANVCCVSDTVCQAFSQQGKITG